VRPNGFLPMPSRPAESLMKVASSSPRAEGYRANVKGDAVGVFIVERALPGLSLERLAAAHRGLAESLTKTCGGSRPIRYLRSTYHFRPPARSYPITWRQPPPPRTDDPGGISRSRATFTTRVCVKSLPSIVPHSSRERPGDVKK
jgi:hypothetical protein